MIKKILLSIILTSLSIGIIAQQIPLAKQDHNVNKVLQEIISSDDFKTASFAFYAIDINTGEIIAEINPNTALKPASTLKLLTTATALELLGPDFQFETTLEYSGELDKEKAILHGNLFIKGGGDPCLGSKHFGSTKDKQFLVDWVQAISNLGIDSISGNIIADARVFSRDMVPTSWSWINMGNYFGAGPCGLSIYDNYYTIYFKTANAIGQTAEIVKIVPNMPGLVFDNTVTADSITYDNTNIFGAPYSDFRSARGQLPVNRHSFPVKGSMPDPAFFAAFQLNLSLKANRINTLNQPKTVRILEQEGLMVEEIRTPFYTHFSPKLSEMIAKTNIHSINLFAEHCLIQSGITLGAKPETQSSADSIVSFWKNKGMDTQGMFIYDGSGLSSYNVITPHQLVYLLKYMKTKSKYFDNFYRSMPIAGKTGTVKYLFRNKKAKREIRVKSGSITAAKSYAGYITSQSGREIAFSVIVNNYSGKSSDTNAKLEKLMIALYELSK